VVKDVYHELKDFGRGNITLPDEDGFSWDEVDSETSQFLIRVWNTYGGIAAWRLRKMTHESGPWSRHFAPDERYTVIPRDEIQRFFETLPAASWWARETAALARRAGPRHFRLGNLIRQTTTVPGIRSSASASCSAPSTCTTCRRTSAVTSR
jgi:hypothetical protein